MGTIKTGGTIGDAYVILCKILDMKEDLHIIHYTAHTHLAPTIKEIFKLRSNTTVEFTNTKPKIFVHGDFKNGIMFKPNYFPNFNLGPPIIEPPYIAIQPNAGRNNERELPNYIVDRLMKNNKVVLVGGDKGSPTTKVKDLRGRLSIKEDINVIKYADKFYGPQGFLSFVALSQRVPSTIYLFNEQDKIAVEVRIFSCPWQNYAYLEEL